MRVPKASEVDKDRFRSVVPVDPRVEVKPMFGNLGAFVNGNMFAGLFGSDIGVKLASTDMAELAERRWWALRSGRTPDDGLLDGAGR